MSTKIFSIGVTSSGDLYKVKLTNGKSFLANSWEDILLKLKQLSQHWNIDVRRAYRDFFKISLSLPLLK